MNSKNTKQNIYVFFRECHDPRSPPYPIYCSPNNPPKPIITHPAKIKIPIILTSQTKNTPNKQNQKAPSGIFRPISQPQQVPNSNKEI